MKKHLLIAFMVTGSFLFAQVNKSINPVFLKPVLNSCPVMQENISPVKAQQKAKRFVQHKNQATCTGKIFTFGPNGYGVGGGSATVNQNCLSYNSDLNAVLWTQRASPLWGFSGYTSGAIQATWLNVGTNLWDSMIIYRDSSNGYRARYPGGIFFNPSGNTNFANANVVGIGPAVSGGTWGGTWYSNRQITGSYHSVGPFLDSNKVCAYGAQPFGNLNSILAGYSGFLNSDLQQVGNNNVYVGGVLADVSVATGNVVSGGTIGKASNLIWAHDTIVPGFYFNVNIGYANDGQGARITFSPNGQIGYAVFIGRTAITHNNSSDSTFSPIVYKTTNGGSTWNYLSFLEGFDWSIGHPEARKKGGNVYRPQITDLYKLYVNHGIDLTVDSLGFLHLVGTVTDPYIGSSGSTDSLVYGYTYNWDYINRRPKIWDFMTDGTTWDALLVDSILTSEMGTDPAIDTTATFNPWSTGGTFLGYGARIQVSRSPTGGIIFYSWADSDPNVTGTMLNTQPDIYIKFYDISNQVVPLMSKNVSQGLSECYFHFMSDVSYHNNTQNGWVCPIVYTTAHSATTPYLAADTVDYHYIDCISFYDSDWFHTTSANIYRAQSGACWGIASHNSLQNSITQNFPNPFSQTTNIVVNLKQAKAVDLKVFDLLGNLVYAKNKTGMIGENTFVFDGTSLQAGVYYYTITVDGQKATKKMVLQK
ncbi:MAG TPA: T9SS type A sorting domain-containing protein [Bacteroidia bacterium]|jgi:hypothetical protein|nr:T9SS type A sorting domain-containing protein [Bacteroidia bacterium]